MQSCRGITALVHAVANPSERTSALRLVAEGKIGRYSLGKVTDAFWCGKLGAHEQALKRLWSPVFDPLRGDERFQAIMQSLGLPNALVPLEEKR